MHDQSHWTLAKHGLGQGVGAVGRTGYLLQKKMGFEFAKHDVESEMPVRDPKTGFCIRSAPGEPGQLVLVDTRV